MQPDEVIPRSVLGEVMLIRTGQVAVAIGSVRAYPNGFEFTAHVRMRSEDENEPGWHDPFKPPREEAVNLDSVRDDPTGVVPQALEPAHVSVWISQDPVRSPVTPCRRTPGAAAAGHGGLPGVWLPSRSSRSLSRWLH
jgi:hypothetical protein